MAGVRVVVGGAGGGKFPSRVKGEQVGMQLNVHGLTRLRLGITGEMLARIAEEAMMLAYDTAKEDWPIDTGASNDTIKIEVLEAEGKRARVALVIGGEELINDPRNKKHIDYAPYIEFNGSPGGHPPGTLAGAMALNEPEMRRIIHDGVRDMIEELTND
jgi:hypothetical protein